MDVDAFRAKLEAMNPQEREAFLGPLGCGVNLDECQRLFLVSPEWQYKFCKAFGEPSEQTRIAESTHAAAHYAWIACVIAGISVGVAVIGVIISLCK